MPQLTIEIPHALGRDEAARRLKGRLDAARAAYQGLVSDLQEEWSDQGLRFCFRAVGMEASGTVDVEDAAVRIHAEVPWVAMMMRGAVEQRIREELVKALA